MVIGVMVEIVITDGGCVLVFSVMQWWLAIYMLVLTMTN